MPTEVHTDASKRTNCRKPARRDHGQRWTLSHGRHGDGLPPGRISGWFIMHAADLWCNLVRRDGFSHKEAERPALTFSVPHTCQSAGPLQQEEG